MKSIVRSFLVVTASLFTLTYSFIGNATTTGLASQMTCNQAVQYYQDHHRIYILANGKDIVPIYGMTPYNERRNLTCSKPHQWMHFYWVKTLDSDSCFIAAYCGN